MRRRSPYDVMAEVQQVLNEDPSMNVHSISKRIGANWLSVRSSIESLEKHGLYTFNGEFRASRHEYINKRRKK